MTIECELGGKKTKVKTDLKLLPPPRFVLNFPIKAHRQLYMRFLCKRVFIPLPLTIGAAGVDE